MELKILLADVEVKEALLSGFSQTPEGIEVSHVTADSRQVTENALFVALSSNGEARVAHMREAVVRGARVIIAEDDGGFKDLQEEVDGGACTQSKGGPLCWLTAENPRYVLAKVAARFYPHAPATMVAVTGTNGKSSVASFIRQIWSYNGWNGACMGTLGLDAPDVEALTHPSFGLTTPDPVGLHRYLEKLAEHGVTHVSLEASSHGLHQYRVSGLQLTAAAFTNLSQDHLDYHGTMEAYFDAKAKLFQDVLPETGIAVLNADSPQFEALKAICRARKIRVLDFGKQADTVKCLDVTPCENGYEVACLIDGVTYQAHVPLFGLFQVSNALCALALGLATGVSPEVAVAALGQLKGVVGRLETVAVRANGARIYVDYAHTPDALEAVLTSVRSQGRGRIILVFGCGGDRDKLKRPLMGEIASRLADVAIVTDDNPRGEMAAQIRQEVMGGASSPLLERGDRGEAIFEACQMAKDGDIVIIAGKGHEQGQLVGHIIQPFDDAQVARDAVRKIETEGES